MGEKNSTSEQDNLKIIKCHERNYLFFGGHLICHLESLIPQPKACIVLCNSVFIS